MNTCSAAISNQDIVLYEMLLIKKNLNECWPWIGDTNKAGYGKFTCVIGNKRTVLLSHRISYYLYKQVDPIGYYVLHECDNPICSNPNHLKLGDQLTNQQDAILRRRRAEQNGLNNGVTSSKASLTVEKVLEIRELKSQGHSHRKIAYLLGLPKSTVGYVCQGKTYKDVL